MPYITNPGGVTHPVNEDQLEAILAQEGFRPATDVEVAEWEFLYMPGATPDPALLELPEPTEAHKDPRGYLSSLTVTQLMGIASEEGVVLNSAMRKADIVEAILAHVEAAKAEDEQSASTGTEEEINGGGEAGPGEQIDGQGLEPVMTANPPASDTVPPIQADTEPASAVAGGSGGVLPPATEAAPAEAGV